jgi:hypothetical protein
MSPCQIPPEDRHHAGSCRDTVVVIGQIRWSDGASSRCGLVGGIILDGQDKDAPGKQQYEQQPQAEEEAINRTP